MGGIQGWGSSFNIDGEAENFKFLFQVALCCCWGKWQMIGDEFLCQYFPCGKVDMFIALMNVEGACLKHGT